MFSTIQHKKTLGNLILMSFSIAVSLIALEVAVRILDNVNLIKLPAGGSLGRSVGLYEHDDLLGWKNRPGFNKEKRYKYGDEYRTVVETINSKGLRDREYTLKKPDNTYRIISLGCSKNRGHLCQTMTRGSTYGVSCSWFSAEKCYTNLYLSIFQRLAQNRYVGYGPRV